MRNTIFTLVLSCLILFGFEIHAKHIVSGSIGYECLGNNDYEITMLLYRDCNGGGAAFDNPAYFGIYTSDGILFEQMTAAATDVAVVPQDSYENCPIDPACLEEATYRFTINLPYNVAGYTIAYQRCCWSEAILNIENPGEHGITVMTEITDLAQTECNTQEIVDIPMAFSSCPGVDIGIPFPDYDSEGDSLVFELCFPLAGAGIDGTPASPNGDPNSCSGIQPIPACPPPYSPLPYATGFSDENPFPTLDGIYFNDETNTIEFTPTTLGLFVYAFCVTEFRNGEVLSQYRYNIFARNDQETSSQELQDGANTHQVWHSGDKNAIMLTTENPMEEVNVSVYSIDGKMMDQSIRNHQTQSLIPSEGWASGIYFVSIANDEFNEVHKVYVK